MKNIKKNAVPLLATLNAINKKAKKLYCYPSQLTLMARMASYQGIRIEIATLNRWLRDIEDNGFIIRQRRIRHDKRLGMVFQSTMYLITHKGYSVLAAVGVTVFKHIKRLYKKGFAVAEKTLGKKRGFASMEEIMGSTLIFGVKKEKLPVKG